MEHGRRLLGALEVAGAALFAAGLAIRTAHRRLFSTNNIQTVKLQDKIVLIIGSNSKLGKELSEKLVEKNCKVICADGTPNSLERLSHLVTYIQCDTAQSSQVSWLEKKVLTYIGEVDVLVWISKDINRMKTPLDQIADIVNIDLMQMIYVMTKFLPNLSSRDGHFVVIEPHGSPRGAFKSTGSALSQLTDTLAQQITNNGSVHTLRVTRRYMRRLEDENQRDSASEIVGALEAGQCSLTLPSATKHIKNTLRYLYHELHNVWRTTAAQRKLKG